MHWLIKCCIKKKKIATKWCAVRPTEKVGRMSLEPWFYKKLCKVDPLQFEWCITLTFMSKNYCKLFQLKKNAIDCTGASMSLSAQTIGCSAHLSRFNVKTLLYAWTVLVYL